MVDQLIVLGQTKGWLRESAWWSLFTATEGLLKSNVPWKQEALDSTVETVFEDKRWSQEKIALALVLEQQLPVCIRARWSERQFTDERSSEHGSEIPILAHVQAHPATQLRQSRCPGQIAESE